MVRRVEHRVTGQFLKVEGLSGIVVSIPGWMVDPLVCAEMGIGQPRVDLAALSELKKTGHADCCSHRLPERTWNRNGEVDEAAQYTGADFGQTDEPDVRVPQRGWDERRGRES